MKWRNFKGIHLNASIVEIVEKNIVREHQAGNAIKICIGTDSEVKRSHVEFATVVLFLRERKGGFMFIANNRQQVQMGIRERMIAEVAYSIEIAYALSPVLDTYSVDLEVHADINCDAKYKSNEAFSAAMGYIKGMGYDFKAKPYAFASTSCADKFC